jgi:endonuclease/exonuclease/phosphatase family metal-dependent hydrolase
MLVEKAKALAEKWDGIPIVLAGDFNCTPDVCFNFSLAYLALNFSLEHNYFQQVFVSWKPRCTHNCSLVIVL